ncbi:predicted protein [Uncinocarpus reesii 1704]|uniref:Uncharacterized protein n=1 Tax=Uncinocarpus reesii (strain UAMH 1704) TaxID=336963 RepID=C4JJ24_UNCRE|nr:uncharacterized protein UREG_01631 [Uncinocarpus reesii 1704]EEP76782.1 predicted protein [Uncinocarpus reesii 1704]
MNQDLASVLETLSSFIPPESSQPPASINRSHEASDQLHSKGQADDDYDPLHFSPLGTFNGADISSSHPARRYHQSPIQPPSSQDRVDSLPDPATITTWPAALKYVMKTVAQSEALQSKIRRLIRSQQDHEKKWWEAREALLAKQRNRAEKKQKLDAVLKSVGGAITTGPEMTTPEEDAAEIQIYDRKVYNAMSDMSKALDAELRGLGIPFFAVRHSLVRPSPGLVGEKAGHVESPKRGDVLSLEDLRDFQQRMFDLLEDLCKE